MTKTRNEILLLLTDRWCDWEASYAIAVANAFSDYVVRTVAVDLTPKISMGGIRAAVDVTIDAYNEYNHLAMLILPGGLSWAENDDLRIVEFVRRVAELSIPVAAICGATFFLCRHGFLDTIRHTGDSLELFQGVPTYRGESHYVEAQVVVDGGFITANETAAVEFAYEIFKQLQVDSEEEIEEWYENFRYGAVR